MFAGGRAWVTDMDGPAGGAAGRQGVAAGAVAGQSGAVGQRVQICSISGGTDLCTPFLCAALAAEPRPYVTAIEAAVCEHRPATVRRSSTADRSADFKLMELGVIRPQNFVFQASSRPASALGIRAMGAACPRDTLRFHS